MLKFRWEKEFKETEIGKVPWDWEITGLQEITEINKTPRGNAGEKANFISMENIPTDSIYPSFFTLNVNEIPSGIEVLPNSILLAKITPSFEHGKMCIVPNITKNRWFATTEVFSIYPKSENNLFFLFYLLKHPLLREPLENSMSGTSGRQRVQFTALKTLSIPLPPLDEQTRIATVLSWFDDLIENKKKQNEILEKTAMAIFKSWFIDFEPFKDEEFVYNEELEKEIPKGWEAKAIGEVFELAKGKKSNLIDEPIQDYLPYLLIENYKTGNYTYWTNEKSPLVDEFDIVIVADGESSGKIFRYQKGVLGSTLLALKQRDHNSDLRHYVYLTLKSTENELMEHRTGSAIPHLDKGFLKSLEILLPPESVLQRFHSLVEPLFQKIILNQKEIMILQKARNALLPELVFGRLRVEEI